MILSELVTQVQRQTGVPRETILRRAREAWPSVVDFKDVQVRLMADQLMKEAARVRPINRVLRTSTGPALVM